MRLKPALRHQYLSIQVKKKSTRIFLLAISASSCLSLSVMAAPAADNNRDGSNSVPPAEVNDDLAPAAPQQLSADQLTPDQLLEQDPTAAGRNNSQGIEEVIVGGKKVILPLRSVKDVPISISVVSGNELEKFEVTRFQDVLKKLGNVRIAGQTGLVTGQNLSLRGIGFPGGSPQDPGIGVSVDGVSYAFTDMAGSFNFYDLESVAVTRGAQGTQGGLAANYGRITFRTHAPTFDDEVQASITAGQRNTLITRAAVGGAVIDDLLAYRVTFLREQADGPFINHYDITQSLYNRDRTSAKIQLLLTADENFSAHLSADFTPKGAEYGSSSFGAFSRATPDHYDTLDPKTGLPIPVVQELEPAGRLERRWFKQDQSYNYLDPDGTKNRVERSDGPPQERDTGGASLELNWKPGNYTVNSITAARDFTFAWHGKNTGLRDVFDIMREPSQAWNNYKQLSEELSIASSDIETGFGKFNYKTGVFYLHTEARTGQPGWGTRFGSDAGAYYATVSQYNALDVDAAGRYLLLNSVDRLNIAAHTKTEGDKLAWFGNIDWNPTERTSINVGVRISDEKSHQLQSASYISHQGYAPELNPVAVNNVQLGGFQSDAKGELDPAKNSLAQFALADSVALKYFKVPAYASLNATQKNQVAQAKAIRAARIGGVYQTTAAEPFDDVLTGANISPNFQINDNHTVYFSWQHGEKAGVSQIVGATREGGKSALTKAEKTNNYDLGWKANLLNDNLILSTSIYYLDINNYIQSLYYYDAEQTRINDDGKPAYTAGLGNVPKITARGIEFDAAYTLNNTTLRFAGAYSDPRYKDFQYAAKPPELGGLPSAPPYYDVSGKTIAGASKVSFNISLEHTELVFGDNELHGNINYNYVSSFNPNTSLSRYAKQDGYGLTDLAIGIATNNRKVDFTLIVRNLFEVEYGSLYDWNSFSPSEPRWIGVSLSSKFF